MNKTFKSVDAFGAEFRTWAPRFFGVASSETQKEIYRTTFGLVAPAAPVGHFNPGAKDHTSPHPGKLRASILGFMGRPRYADLPDRSAYTVPGFAEAETPVRGHRPGVKIGFTYAAKTDGQSSGYAASIEAGLRVRNGQRYGSKQAPGGWVGIRVRNMKSHMPGILRRAIAATLRMVAP